MIDGATYFAWFVLAFLFLVAVWTVVALGSLPKKIALQRNHPQVDAINAASWMGLLLGGVGWVIAFVWAHLRSGNLGHGDPAVAERSAATAQDEIDRLRADVARLEGELKKCQANKETE